MKNFEQIAETPEALAAFLAALPVADGPWDAEFRRVFCVGCLAENCDGDNCPHNAERNNPLWWLSLEAAKGKGAIIGQLKNLCSFCREMGKRGGIWAERAWSADVETLEVAVGILSELEGMKEVRISAAPEKEPEK